MKTTVTIQAESINGCVEAVELISKALGFELLQVPTVNNPNFDELNMLDSDTPATIELPYDELQIIISGPKGFETSNTFYKLSNEN